MRRMLYVKQIGVFFMLLGFTVSAAHGQLAPPAVTVTPLPVGSGARALGQSAFIGVADDATAASWNPAGLIQLEAPEVSVVGSWMHATYDFASNDDDLTIGSDSWSESDLNFLSFAYPFRIGDRNFVASLNYHQVYEFGLNIDFMQTIRGQTTDTLLPLQIDVESSGAVSSTSLAGSLSVTPSLAVGAAFNIHGHELFESSAWEVRTRGAGSGLLAGKEVTAFYDNTETFDNFEGYNFSLGLLWDVWASGEKKLTLGMTASTPFTADLERETRTVSVLDDAMSVGRISEDFEMDFPASAGIGLNYRMSDAWSVSGDVQWTDWSEFSQEDALGNRSSPIGGGPIEDIEDTVAARLGTEYLFFREESVLGLRGGLFYEPRPALGDPTDVYGFSVGTGLTTSRCSLDLAYQFRWADDISGRNLGLGDDIDFDDAEHLFLASLIVYF